MSNEGTTQQQIWREQKLFMYRMRALYGKKTLQTEMRLSRTLRDVRFELDQFRLKVVTNLRDKGMTFAEIMAVTGLPRNRISSLVRHQEWIARQAMKPKANPPDVSDMDVNDLRLSVRTANCLNNSNLFKVADIIPLSNAALLKYRNFGTSCLANLDAALEEVGLKRSNP